MGKSIAYGYIIRDGKIEIDEREVQQVKKLFHAYLAGNSFEGAADHVGLSMSQSGGLPIKNILVSKTTHLLLMRMFSIKQQKE